MLIILLFVIMYQFENNDLLTKQYLLTYKICYTERCTRNEPEDKLARHVDENPSGKRKPEGMEWDGVIP